MISVIFSCMNRLDNLRTSLSSWVGSHPTIDDVTVVDWSSETPIHEDPCVSRMDVKIVRVEGERYFSLAKSYNLAFRHTDPKNKILLKLDADYMLKDPRWLDHVRNQVTGLEGISSNGRLSDYFITGSPMFSSNLSGLVLLNKDNFVGYNENMEGYGHDDIEMYERMRRRFPSLREIPFFNIKDYVLHIPHSDEERVRNYEVKDMTETNIKNMAASPDFEPCEYEETSRKGKVVTVRRLEGMRD